jgi:putative PIN family toxin of toxin-antitoxin system
MAPLRVVLDTNVVVSAHLREVGYERLALDAALTGKLSLCLSPAVFAEYDEVLRRPKLRIDLRQVDASLRLIRENAVWVHPTHPIEACLDPDDNLVLECAAEAQAAYLVTGNKRHFPTRWGVTRIVNARELAEIVAGGLRNRHR